MEEFLKDAKDLELKKISDCLEINNEKEDVEKFCRDEIDKQRSQMEEADAPPPASEMLEDPSLPDSNVMLHDESEDEEIVIKKQKVKKRKRSSIADEDEDWEEEQLQPKKKRMLMPVVKNKKRKPRKKRNWGQ